MRSGLQAKAWLFLVIPVEGQIKAFFSDLWEGAIM
jgi:hypothetical protein